MLSSSIFVAHCLLGAQAIAGGQNEKITPILLGEDDINKWIGARVEPEGRKVELVQVPGCQSKSIYG